MDKRKSTEIAESVPGTPFDCNPELMEQTRRDELERTLAEARAEKEEIVAVEIFINITMSVSQGLHIPVRMFAQSGG